MLTYGRHRPRSSPAGDYKCLCSMCGAAYYRSRLIKTRGGMIRCRQCVDKRNEIELAEAIAGASAARQPHYPPRDGGQTDPDDGV